MAFVTKVITLILVFDFVKNVGVNAGWAEEGKYYVVEIKLNNLAKRLYTKNDETKSEISSLEESISSLNSSVNVLNETTCSLSEVSKQVLRTIKQTKEVLPEMEREKTTVMSDFKNLKKSIKIETKAWEKEIDVLLFQMNSLQITHKNLENLFKRYMYTTKNNTMKNCEISNGDQEGKRETSEGLPSTNKPKRNNNSTILPCLNGWLLFRKHCYYYDKNDKQTFTSARDYCRQSNAYIADVGSISESRFIYRLTGKVETWIGVSDIKAENVWISERTNRIVEYTKWLPGDPDGGYSQNCAMLGYRRKMYHKWIDAPCRSQKNFVCKKEATPVK